jgi:hypothetical protein
MKIKMIGEVKMNSSDDTEDVSANSTGHKINVPDDIIGNTLVYTGAIGRNSSGRHQRK